MARFRTNHSSSSKTGGNTIVRVGLFGAIIAGLVYFFNQSQQEPSIDYAGEAYYLPSGGTGQVVHHQGFSLSYDNNWEQAEWTAHILTASQLRQQWNRRQDNWRKDDMVRGGTASTNDYRGSGYDRGHLVPFADLAWNAEWADESFMMSNISPQARQFNQGIWRELEELTRDWAKKFDRLYVITGPVMTRDPKGEIGRETKVAIPAAYFKVLLDLEDPEQKGIGFILPNQVSYDPLFEYAASIDEVEALTGLDFFGDLLPSELEDELEANGNIDLWPFNQRKYNERINDWNNVND
ncbi:MAG: DNA/RNA non-specific endonuclease [Bacteroidota bacterium]